MQQKFHANTLFKNQASYTREEPVAHERAVHALLARLKTTTDAQPCPESPTSVFYARTPPTITVEDYMLTYLSRLPDFAHPNTLACAILYIERVARRRHNVVCERSVHRLLLAGLVVATKVLHDMTFTNRVYAEVGLLPVSELNWLELMLLRYIKFDIHVRTADYRALRVHIGRPMTADECEHTKADLYTCYVPPGARIVSVSTPVPAPAPAPAPSS